MLSPKSFTVTVIFNRVSIDVVIFLSASPVILALTAVVDVLQAAHLSGRYRPRLHAGGWPSWDKAGISSDTLCVCVGVCLCVCAHRPLQPVCQRSKWARSQGGYRSSSAGPGWRSSDLPQEVLQWGQQMSPQRCVYDTCPSIPVIACISPPLSPLHYRELFYKLEDYRDQKRRQIHTMVKTYIWHIVRRVGHSKFGPFYFLRATRPQESNVLIQNSVNMHIDRTLSVDWENATRETDVTPWAIEP